MSFNILQTNSPILERIEDMLVPVQVAYAGGDLQSHNIPAGFGKDFFGIPDNEVCFTTHFYNRIVGGHMHILGIINVKVFVIISALGYSNLSESLTFLGIRDISGECSGTCENFRRKLIQAISCKGQEKRKKDDPYFYFDENKTFHKAVSEQYLELFDKYVVDNDLVDKLVPSKHKIPRGGCMPF